MEGKSERGGTEHFGLGVGGAEAGRGGAEPGSKSLWEGSSVS